MTLAFLLLAVITIFGMGAAMSLRNPVHCVVGLTMGFLGLAGLYLQLGAQFIGLTQVLVYVGAVAILIIFAIMMTRGSESTQDQTFSHSWRAGVAIAAALFAVIGWAIHFGAHTLPTQTAVPELPVQQIGDALLHRFVLPLEIIAVLLTAALIGAGVLALQDPAGEVRGPR
jgi:NADH:ubiquinone oxidoreductase subunit 6 (subunit J)